jgi:hypothetical protein
VEEDEEEEKEMYSFIPGMATGINEHDWFVRNAGTIIVNISYKENSINNSFISMEASNSTSKE